MFDKYHITNDTDDAGGHHHAANERNYGAGVESNDDAKDEHNEGD